MTTLAFQRLLNSPLTVGQLTLPHRLIQGPLAGISCAPFRQLFNYFTAPAYCVSEMISAHDILHKHNSNGRYLYRAVDEPRLGYQIAGHNANVMAEAAIRLQTLSADLVDINCGCPKHKIRKKGAGSALLQQPERLIAIVKAVRLILQCPLTVKIRLQDRQHNIAIAQQLADHGVDALIVHGRRWVDDYDIPCNLAEIARIKQAVSIPVIVNGDITDTSSLYQTFLETGCDGFMISRAGTGRPWLFQNLLTNTITFIDSYQQIQLFLTHLKGLISLEGEYQAVLQSKSWVRYYFCHADNAFLQAFYQLSSLHAVERLLDLQANKLINTSSTING
jgi:tRNA-dihydrouridine synthase B